MSITTVAGEAGQPRRRILMIAACPFPAPRGTPVRILRVAEALARRGHTVHVATYHLGGSTEGLPFEVHRIPRVPTYNKMDPGPTYQKLAIVDPLLAGNVLRLARRLRPDIIHAHHYEGLITALPAKYIFGIPVVFDSHVLLQAELHYYDLKGLGKAKRDIGMKLDRYLTRRADHVIPVAKEIRAHLIQQNIVDHLRITVAHNGVEHSFFEGAPGAFPADGLRRIIFTGNLALYQGVDLLLRAFADLLRQRKDVQLVVVSNDQRDAFEQLARDAGVLGHIDFLDADLERLPHQIASADIAVNPRTDCPGVPQKLLNYMAAGAAVVSFQGSAKHLSHDETGLIVADDDTAAFAAAMNLLLDDDALRRRLGAEAKLYARQYLSWDNCAAICEGVYERLLTRSGPQSDVPPLPEADDPPIDAGYASRP